MAIVVVILVCMAAAILAAESGRWEAFVDAIGTNLASEPRVPLRYVLLDRWSTGLVAVVVLAVSVEFWSLYPFVREKDQGHRSFLTRWARDTRTVVGWMAKNGGAALLVGFPLLALLASPLLDSWGLPTTIGTVLLMELVGTSLVSGWLWGRRVTSRPRRRLPPRGVAIFLLSNIVSLTTVLVVGWHWHAVADWYEDRLGPVRWEGPSWKTSGIEFAAFERADELSIEELAKHVDVRRVDLRLPPDDPKACGKAIWDAFANNPHERSFNPVPLTESTQRDYWDALATEIVVRAATLGAPTDSLRVFLDRLGESGYGHQLPVAAYLASAGERDTWVIVGKWESARSRPDEPLYAGHVIIWAVDALSGRLIGDQRCM